MYQWLGGHGDQSGDPAKAAYTPSVRMGRGSLPLLEGIITFRGLIKASFVQLRIASENPGIVERNAPLGGEIGRDALALGDAVMHADDG